MIDLRFDNDRVFSFDGVMRSVAGQTCDLTISGVYRSIQIMNEYISNNARQSLPSLDGGYM
jgi:hypothetical protein